MERESHERKTAQLTDEELGIVRGALREVLYGAYAIPEWEWQTLLGTERSEAVALQDRLRKMAQESN